MKKLIKILIFLLVLILALYFLFKPTAGFTIVNSGNKEEASTGQGFIAHNLEGVAPLLTITAYCDKGTMASGKETYIGAIACPREIPLKTQVKIEGKTYTCEDRTHIRFNGRYDIFMESCDEALKFGIKKLKLEL